MSFKRQCAPRCKHWRIPCRNWSPRTWALFTNVIAQLFFGVLYGFGSIAPELERQGLATHIPVNMLGTAAQIGTYVLGAFAAVMADRWSGYTAVAYGAIVSGIGWVLVLIASEIASSGSYTATVTGDAFACIAFLLVGQGAAAGFVGAWASLGSVFPPSQRGTVAGSLLAAYSLSAGLCAVLMEVLFQHDLAGFCWFMGIGGVIIGTIAAWMLYKLQKQPDQRPLVESMEAASDANSDHDIENASCDSGTIQTSEQEEKVKVTHSNIIERLLLRWGLDRYGWLAQPSFWMLYTISFCIIGAAMLFVNSVSTMAASLSTYGKLNDEDTSFVDHLVLAFAIVNTVSRFLCGKAQDALARHQKSRLHPIFVACAASIFAAILSLIATWNILIGIAIFCGIAEGVTLAVWPVVARVWFRTDKPAILFAVMNTSIGIGSLVFNAIGAAWASDVESTQTNDSTESNTCLGRECFRGGYIVAICLSSVAAFIAVILIRMEPRILARNSEQPNTDKSISSSKV